ncbi:MAG: hypothetical protein ACM3NQ_19400 [Bacteroidales bacterium]
MLDAWQPCCLGASYGISGPSSSSSGPPSQFAVGYLLPTFLGNTIGGVSLVAAVNHAQVVAGTATEG